MSSIRTGAAALAALLLAACAQAPQRPAPADFAATTDDGDLWQRLRGQLSFADTSHPDVQRQLQSLRPRSIASVADNASNYLYFVLDATQSRGMPAEVALVPWFESGYRPNAVSPGRAAGLWQLMPDTATHLGLSLGRGVDERKDVKASTEAALDYLARLNRNFDGDWLLTLAAYNAGPKTVQNAIERNRRAGRPTAFWDLDLPRITQEYVPRILALSQMIASPERFGLNLPDAGENSALTHVDLGPGVNPMLAAAAAGLSREELLRYNARLRGRDDTGSTELLLPKARAEALARVRPRIEGTKLAVWEGYRLAPGDTIEAIAERFDTSPAALREVNREAGATLSFTAGREVLVPARGPVRLTMAAAPAQRPKPQTGRLARAKKPGKPEHRPAEAGDGLFAGDVPLRERIRRLLTINLTVRPGDSLAVLSGQYSVAIEDLRRWNDLPASTPASAPLEAGRTVVVYVDAIADDIPRG